MTWIFILARVFPFFALGLALVFIQLGLFYRRRGSKSQWLYFGLTIGLFGLTIMWFFFRGDLYSDRWLRGDGG